MLEPLPVRFDGEIFSFVFILALDVWPDQPCVGLVQMGAQMCLMWICFIPEVVKHNPKTLSNAKISVEEKFMPKD